MPPIRLALRAPRLTVLFFTVSLVLTCLMVYLGHTIFLAQGNLAGVLPGQSRQDSMARFQIGFERMHNQLLRFAWGLDPASAPLIEQYRLLQEQFAALAGPGAPELAPELTSGAGRARLQELSSFMQQLGSSMPALSDRASAAALAQRFEALHQPLEQMTEAVRAQQRGHAMATAEHVALLRRSMYVSGLLLWANFSVWVTLLLLSMRQSRALIRQQALAIDAEHEAVVAGQHAVMNKNTMLGMISHELRTPLQTIISSIDLLTLHSQKQDASSAVVARLGDASIQLEAQLKDLTDYARIDSAKLSLRMGPCNPAALLRATVANFESRAARKGLALVADIADTSLAIVSDEYRIQQIASNLVSNAIKYCEQGEVRVELAPLHAGSASMTFRVTDTGPGIEAHELPHLFEPFTQIDQSHTRRYDGAGLGLAIVRGLVDLFGGTIKVDSTPGRGTCFEVSLPAVAASAAPSAAPELVSAPARSRILLVDDNADVRASLKEVIEQLGYQCEVADGGAAALRKAGSQPFSAILLDIQMPLMDGFAVAERMRAAHGPNQATPIIAISAYSHKHNTEHELRCFSDYLMKPIRQERLRALLQAAVRQPV